MNPTLPNAKSSIDPHERKRLKALISKLGLCGLANDSKWNELIETMRNQTGWKPYFRWKYVDGIPVSWDREWFYHLPFPMIGVEWFDLTYLEETVIHRLPIRVEWIDHSEWIVPLLNTIGLDFKKGLKLIRIFGYTPRNMNLFDEEIRLSGE